MLVIGIGHRARLHDYYVKIPNRWLLNISHFSGQIREIFSGGGEKYIDTLDVSLNNLRCRIKLANFLFRGKYTCEPHAICRGQGGESANGYLRLCVHLCVSVFTLIHIHNMQTRYRS